MIKVKHQHQIHIFKVDRQSINVLELQDMVRKNFKHCPKLFGFSYLDAEGDQIDVSTDEDLSAIFQLQEMQSKSTKKVMIKLQLKELFFEKSQVIELELEVSVHNSFEILTQSSSSQYQQLKSSELSDSLILLQAEDEAVYFEQIMIADIAKSNLNKIYLDCIENALRQTEEKIIQCQVQNYLNDMYEGIAKMEEQELKRAEFQEKRKLKLKKMKQDKKKQQVTLMIKTSLDKLMPDFIKRLSQKTIDSVKQILASQKDLQC